ncbi:MAG TPA: multiheme c-type cytochrome [Polyangia bacterium]
MSSSWLLAVVLAADLFPRGLAPIDAGAPAADKLRAAACIGCHRSVHADWAQSRHGLAWTNAVFQREYKDRPLDWCVHCHAPLVEQFAEVKRGGGPLADEGVNCAVCHIRQGRIVARNQSPASPHDTDARADFGGPGYCAGCHQFSFPTIDPDPEGKGPGRVTGYTEHPMQDTVNQHARGPHADKECLGCHQRETATHRFPGGHDAAMIAGALQLSACRDRDALVVSLANTGAGHNVPTGDLHRHLVLRAWRAGAPEKLQEVVLGRRFAPAPDGGKLTVADTSIRAGETRRLRLPVARTAASPAEPISLELRLVYTIDEFPFAGRELREPTYATMIERQVDWQSAPRCSTRR